MKDRVLYKLLPMNINIFDGAFWLGVWATLISMMTAFIIPISSFIYLMAALVICDMVTGIMAARKREEEIRAKKLWRTGSKLIAYMIAFLLARGVEMVYPMVHMPYIVSVPIVISEFKSNIENIEEVTEVKIWSFVKDFVSLLKMKR